MNASGVDSATTSVAYPAWDGSVENVTMAIDGLGLPAERLVPRASAADSFHRNFKATQRT